MAKTEKESPKPAETTTEAAPATGPAGPPPSPAVAPLPVGGQTLASTFAPRGAENFDPNVFDPPPRRIPPAPDFNLIGQQQAPRPRAVRVNTSEGVTFRPPPGVGLALLGDVVIGNWKGMVEGKPCKVKHGTPAEDLPNEVLRAILATPEISVGPFNPNPQAAAEPGRR